MKEERIKYGYQRKENLHFNHPFEFKLTVNIVQHIWGPPNQLFSQN